MKLEGKTAIITGATSGIGEASAILFAQEGAKVTIAGRSDAGECVAEKIRKSGGNAQFVCTDVTKSEDIQALFDAHLKQYQRLDILFNNASYEGPGTSVSETTEEEAELVWRTNFQSVFLACRLAAPIMASAGRGSIINTTAASAREGLAWPNLGAYIGSKGGVISFTRALAMELSPQGVRVNSLNPGLVDTPMLCNFINKQDDPEAFRAWLNQAQLLKRMGKPEEIARAALFLASDDASYVTGSDMLVDGGLVLG